VWYNKQVETFKIITMHEPTYRQALSHSWKLAWHHKLIWIFGLFAAFLGQMGLLELLGSVSMHASSSSATLGLGNLTWIKMLCAGELRVSLPITGWVWLVWLLVMFLGFGIFLIFVSVSSQGALIHASAQWAKKDTLPDTDKSWHAGVQHFWPLFFINVFKKVDVLICPVSPTLPFKIGEKNTNPLDMYLDDIFTVNANLAGIPSLALPCGFIDDLPVGIQIIGPDFSEKLLYQVGYSYEQETKWYERTPKL